MLPDRVSNPGPLTYESGALPIAPRGPASIDCNDTILHIDLNGKVLSPTPNFATFLFKRRIWPKILSSFQRALKY